MKEKVCLDNKTILITGVAGFIGAYLAKRLIEECADAVIVGIDNMTDYYDVRLKQWRLNDLEQIGSENQWIFCKGSIDDGQWLQKVFAKYEPKVVVNLAAQAGVRYSIENPRAYIDSNIIGFFNILECCRAFPVEHLVYASSSSVYGGNAKIPFSEEDAVDHPVSLYAATKKSNELMAYTYSKLYDIPTTGLRFFTVYGPAGRPDMAYFSFTERLRKHQKIRLFNYGDCRRDFTYIADIVEGIFRIMQGAPQKSPGADGLPNAAYDVYNIGNSSPDSLMDFVNVLTDELINAGVLESGFDMEECMELVPMQPGDVPVTFADTRKLERDFGYRPYTSLKAGLRCFAEWYREYYMNFGKSTAA